MATLLALNGVVIVYSFAIDPLLAFCLACIFSILVVVFIRSFHILCGFFLLELELVDYSLREPFITFLAAGGVAYKANQTSNN
jgi:CBS-domain-containing membrane protein